MSWFPNICYHPEHTFCSIHYVVISLPVSIIKDNYKFIETVMKFEQHGSPSRTMQMWLTPSMFYEKSMNASLIKQLILHYVRFCFPFCYIYIWSLAVFVTCTWKIMIPSFDPFNNAAIKTHVKGFLSAYFTKLFSKKIIWRKNFQRLPSSVPGTTASSKHIYFFDLVNDLLFKQQLWW